MKENKERLPVEKARSSHFQEQEYQMSSNARIFGHLISTRHFLDSRRSRDEESCYGTSHFTESNNDSNLELF